MKSVSLARPMVAVGLAVAFAAGALPATATAATVDQTDAARLDGECLWSNDPDKSGAKGCFLDNSNGNDDAVWVKDLVSAGGDQVAYAAVYEQHIYGWTHEAGETDGGDKGGDKNVKFNVGQGGVRLVVCTRDPDRDYDPGDGDNCKTKEWAEGEG